METTLNNEVKESLSPVEAVVMEALCYLHDNEISFLSLGFTQEAVESAIPSDVAPEVIGQMETRYRTWHHAVVSTLTKMVGMKLVVEGFIFDYRLYSLREAAKA
jgi:hypothetical protein